MTATDSTAPAAWEKRCREICLFLTAVFLSFSLIGISLKTVYIDDNGKVTSVVTVGNDPLALLKKQGVTLKTNDTLSVPDKLSWFSTISITRSVKVEVLKDGKTHTIYTSPDTVLNILSQNVEGFDESSDIVVYPTGQNSYLTAEETVHTVEIITPPQIEKIVVHEKSDIGYKTTYESDPLLLKGQQAVLTSGEKGVREISYEVVLKDGEQISKTAVGETVLKASRNRVVRVGIGSPGGEISVDGSELNYKNMFEMRATAYWSGSKTATGTVPKRGVVAVDPAVIPLGSRLYIVAADGSSWTYGFAMAEDTGGAIRGNKIDLFVENKDIGRRFGVRYAKVYILE